MAKKKTAKRYRLSDIMREIAITSADSRSATSAFSVRAECEREPGTFEELALALFASLPAALRESPQQQDESDRDYVERMAQAAVREARRLGVPMVECGP